MKQRAARQIGILILAVSLLAVRPPKDAVAQVPRFANIEGVPPYALGAPQDSILKVNSTLEQGTANILGDVDLIYEELAGLQGAHLPTTNYRGFLKGGAEGLSQDAMLGLQFYQDRLVAVTMWWPNYPPNSPRFPQIGEIRGEDAEALYRRLKEKYGQPAEDTLRASQGRRGSMTIRDDSGNTLIMFTNIPGLGAVLTYGWAPFVKEVEGLRQRR